MIYKYLKISFVGLGLTVGTHAYGVCYLSSNFTTVNINMAIGKVVAKPSDPVGKVLYTKRVDIPDNPYSTMRCDYWGRAGDVNAVLMNNKGLAMEPSIYKTNVSGIGIRLYREVETGKKFSGYYPYRVSLRRGRNYSLGKGHFVIEIVKTAENTGTGSLTQGLYSSYYLQNYPHKPILTSSVIGDTITITSSSCEIQSNKEKVVKLPTVKKSGFSGIGSTQGEQAFDINILCNGGENIQTPDKISVSFDYDTVSNVRDVLKNVAPESTRAKGVGTQIVSKYQGSNNVVAKGEAIKLGDLNASKNVSYNLPMVARYYQTDSVVSAGEVNSIATITIEYD